MEWLIDFYIFIFYLTLIMICYCILGYVKPNKYHSLLNNLGIGENFILASWIVLIFYFCFRVYIDNEMNNTLKINYTKFKKIAKTGDIIMYRWEYVDVGFRMFSKFSHVAMVVRKGKKLYLLETHPNENKNSKNKSDNQGIHLYLLKNRIKKYNGQCYLASLNKDIDTKNLTKYIVNDLDKFKKIPFDNGFRDLYVYNFFANRLGIKLQKKKEMFCSEFIGYLLHKYNIYNHNENLASIEPGTFLNFKQKNKKIFSDLLEICIA